MKVSPVYIYNVGDLATLNEGAIESFAIATRKKLVKMLSNIRSFRTDPPKVIFNFDGTLKSDIESLSKHAVTNGDSLMIAATRGRSGLRRFLEDSFIENLVAKSRIPVVTVNESTRPIKKIARIVFATDFTPESFRVFDRLCAFALETGAKIHIYSAIPRRDFDEFFYETAAWAWNETDILRYDYERKHLRALAKKFERCAKKHQVTCEVKIDEGAADVATSILNYCRVVNADLLALAAKSDTGAVSLFGNLTQSLIRKSSFPVWTYRAAHRKNLQRA